MKGTERYLITGFAGFVSHHFLDFLERNKIDSKVLGVDVQQPDFDFHKYTHVKSAFRKLDLSSKAEVENVINEFKPDYVLHLASNSSVAMSWKNPVESFKNNTNIFLNLIETIRISGIKCRILSVGSSEEYGNVNKNDLPLKEDHSLKPVSPYAVARVSQEMLSRVYVDSFGMDIVMTRSFNHIGRYQKDVFVIPSFAKQLLSFAKTNSTQNELVTGNTAIVRDFVDVRDVVNAYYALFKKGKKGELYNICTGNGTSLHDAIQIMANELKISVSNKINPELVRPNDNDIIIGSNEKIKNDTGWKPTFSIEESLKEVLDYFQTL